MSASTDKSTITIEGDQRITKFGAILRKNKLDELPELWNVLIGDMSFVGPRPDVPGYADKLVGDERDLLKLKPGITGPATLKYRNEEKILAKHSNPEHYNNTVIYPDKVRINIKYLKNHTIIMDIMIIIHTIFRIKPKKSWIS